MELTSAIAIVESVKTGLLAVCGLAAAVAAMLAVVRYFTNGADPNARRQLITRCGHIFGSVACIGLVISIATPLSTSLMKNATSEEISGDAKGSSWLPRVDVNGKKVKVESGNALAKSGSLGDALRRAAMQQRVASGGAVESDEGTVLVDSPIEAGNGAKIYKVVDKSGKAKKFRCGICKSTFDTQAEAQSHIDTDHAALSNPIY